MKMVEAKVGIEDNTGCYALGAVKEGPERIAAEHQ